MAQDIPGMGTAGFMLAFSLLAILVRRELLTVEQARIVADEALLHLETWAPGIATDTAPARQLLEGALAAFPPESAPPPRG
jgi:hypothetical protein